MKLFILFLFLLCPVAAYSAETESQETASPRTQTEEPQLYDHYLFLKRMQESMAGRSLEEQAKLQPQLQREQRRACERLRKDHRERVEKEEYRRQGGDGFLVFSWELEQWCGTLP